jgi:hypothetical protein
MNDSNQQIHLFYRHVHVSAEARSRDPNKSRPAWFSHHRCFENLLETIQADPQGHRVKITIVYDSPPEALESDFIAPYVANSELSLKLQFIKGGSDLNSFLITLALAKALPAPETDLVYFLENDYLHQHGWVSKVLELYNSGKSVDVVSLYDHKDKYFLAMYNDLAAKLHVTDTHHWRTAPSTCASFILSKAALERDYDVLAAGETDYYFFTKLVNGRGRTLLTPIPGLATHAMEGYLSPAVDWHALAR